MLDENIAYDRVLEHIVITPEHIYLKKTKVPSKLIKNSNKTEEFNLEKINGSIGRIDLVYLKESNKFPNLHLEEMIAIYSTILNVKKGLEEELSDTPYMKEMLDSMYSDAIENKLFYNSFMPHVKPKRNRINELADKITIQNFIDKYNSYISILKKTDKSEIKQENKQELSKIVTSMNLNQKMIDTVKSRFIESYEEPKSNRISIKKEKIEYHSRLLKSKKGELFIRTIPLVMKLSKESNYETSLRLDEIKDKFSLGLIGLMKATDSFDYTSNTNFRSYARWIIKHEIYRNTINHQRNIKITENAIRELNMLRSIKINLMNKLDRNPKNFEIVDKFNSEAEKKNKMKKDKLSMMTLEKLRHLMFSKNNTISLSTPLKNNNEEFELLGNKISYSNWSNELPEKFKNPEELTIQSELKNKVHESLNYLTPQETKVLKLRFSIDNQREHTLDEIGKKLGGISRERVRQIEAKAFDRLRQYKSKELMPFIQ